MHEVLSSIISWYMSNINYGTICVLMAIESSFIPFPSEVVVPPAAWKAANGELNLWLVMLSSTGGAMIGALANYYLALWLGRPVIYRLADTKWAHLLLIKQDSIVKAENYFLKYGNISTFIGRLVPAIRQLISIPAGLARMKMGPFLFYTLLGAGIWNVILAALGYFLYSQKELLERYYHLLSYAFIGLAVAVIIFFVIKARAARQPSAA